MKKIYIAVATLACIERGARGYEHYKACLKKLEEEHILLQQALIKEGFEVLNYESNNAELQENKAGIVEFVAQADLVVALCSYPSIGFGATVSEAIRLYHKPSIALIHDRNFNMIGYIVEMQRTVSNLSLYAHVEEALEKIKNEIKQFASTGVAMAI